MKRNEVEVELGKIQLLLDEFLGDCQKLALVVVPGADQVHGEGALHSGLRALRDVALQPAEFVFAELLELHEQSFDVFSEERVERQIDLVGLRENLLGV